ncbi:MAG TPA: sialidase family protein [Solirubrobacteraceae bacterium]|nr:sialidase family protein [Solirubrobacteraceae bacterium]
MRFFGRRALTVAGVFVFAAANAALGASAAVAATTTAPGYTLANVGPFGGEPSITSNGQGELYDTTPSGGTLLYKSIDQGATWSQTTTADPSSGDDCVATDQSGAIYLCNLAGSQSTGPLQTDVWKSVDDGKSWIYGNNNVDVAAGSNVCGTSCNPFGTDRPWTDAYIPPQGTTDTARVA